MRGEAAVEDECLGVALGGWERRGGNERSEQSGRKGAHFILPYSLTKKERAGDVK